MIGDFAFALALAMFFATLIVILVNAYNDPPDWWRLG